MLTIRKYTYIEVKKRVESLGYELISEEYINNKTKITIADNEGFYYLTIFRNFKIHKTTYKFAPSNPYTINNIKLWLKLNNIQLELLSNIYKGFSYKLLFKDICGYYYEISLNNLLSGQFPRKFHTSNSYTIQNIHLWVKLNNKPFKLLSTTYNGNNVKLKWMCFKKECGDIFKSSLNEILNNSGCGVCHGKQIGISNCLANKNPELAKEWHPTKNGDLTPYDVTASSRKEVYWLCPICFNVWKRKIATRNYCGCPNCKQSHGEKEIVKFLNLYGFKYNYNKQFENLTGLGNGNLSYDFYLYDYNLLIEYQGEQHEKYIKGLHKSKKDFEKQQEHDRRKREYAKNNNIRLLEIWYWDFDNIEEILKKEIN